MSGPVRRSAGIDLLRGLAVGLVILAHALPDAFPGAGVVGVVMFDRPRRIPATPGPTAAALLGLALPSVIQLRGHPFTYLAGGPAIAILTGVLLLRRREWYDVPEAPLLARRDRDLRAPVEIR